MVKHPKMVEWDHKMKSLFDQIDDVLEDTYGGQYPLHPNRMPRNSTSNKEMDGLFNVGASYSAGFGTEIGKGYVVDIHMSTLSMVPEEIRKEIEALVENKLDELLPVYFPGRKLEVDKDGHCLKIHGDLSLGEM